MAKKRRESKRVTRLVLKPAEKQAGIFSLSRLRPVAWLHSLVMRGKKKAELPAAPETAEPTKKARRRPFLTVRWLFMYLVIIGLAGIGVFYQFILKDLPRPNTLVSSDIPLATKIYDRNGTLLYEIFAEQNRTLVTLDRIPLYLRQATIAIEDKDFYQHQGVDPIGGVLRAIKSGVEKRRLEGGSTITQQLIKNALLTPERTIQRKIKEIILATWSELTYSKDQILEMYLNQVPYGGTAWGVEAAARKYFDKDVSELSLAESALLAGLPQSPTRFSPFGTHPDLARSRQHQVLRRMVEDGYITAEEAEAAEQEPLAFALDQEEIQAPHLVMYVKDQLVDEYGEKVVEQGGLKVTTTLDLPLQDFAQDVVATEVAELTGRSVSNGAALITRPPTGEILAMVGSIDYFAEGFGSVNVAIRHRQPGSSIKPVNYAIGIENKTITPATVFLDIPSCFRVQNQPLYCPHNYDGSFHGPVQTRFALGNSYNIPAVKALALNTVPTMVASASAFGLDTINDPTLYGLSLTLGGGEVTMVDMAEAFSTFANGGIRQDLVSILKVEDRSGTVLYEYDDPNIADVITEPLDYPTTILIEGERAISPETAFLISHMLLDNNARSAAFGSSSSLVIRGKQAVSVKTGTTDDLRDNWTIGYTPNFLVAVWVGNNDNTPMNRALVSGVSGAAPIWNQIMTKVLENQEDLWPRQPDGVVGRSICSLSGRTPVEGSACGTRYEYFIKGTEPGLEEPERQQIVIDKETNNIAPAGQTENIETQEHPVVRDVFGDLYCLDCPPENRKPLLK